MKVKSLTNRVGYDSWTSGSLNPNHYDTYAEYFVLFVKAFAKEGIPIYAVTPQNEPLNRGNCASLYMPWEEEAAFVNKLAPAFAHAGIKTKIYCFDHNYNYDNIADQQDYPIKFFNALDPDMDGRDLVVGSAWHDYGGSVTELDDINSQAPDKEVIFTETSIGTWNDGRNLSARLLADMQNLVYNTVMRRSKAVMVWNFMLDLNRGPNLDGGCQTCYGAVDIDQNDYHTLSYNSHYYVMAHASLAAHPGARRIGVSLSGGASDVAYVAFQNPDGSYGAIFSNSGSTSIMMSMSATSNAVARFTLPAKSIVTVVLGGKEDEALLLGSTSIKPTKCLGCYKGTVDLKQLDDLSQNFIDNPADWHIAPDFFWYDDADASLTVLPVDGRYEVEIDKAARTLLAAPVADDLTDDGQGNIYVCGPAGSVGRVFYYPGAETLPENAFAMAEVKDGIYEYTFAIGEQLNDEAIDFAFYLKDDLSEKFSSKTTAPHCLVYDSKQGSTYFGLGKGLSGHADGHIYKRVSNVRLKEGSLWTAVVDVRNGLKDASVYIRKAHETPTGLVPSFRNADGKEKGGMPVGVCYDLQGRRVANDKLKGIYIIRDNDSTRKIARR